jgi:UDP-N-acetylmuramyl pentapeptide phosphotransferase/UDP-N-acetylglucosamine-1-phosphate transferase
VASPLIVFLIAAVAAGLSVGLFVSAAFANLIVDKPNDRSLHVVPTARTGGLGLLAGAGTAWALSADAGLNLTAGLAAALAAIVFIDDARGLPAVLRVVLQVSTAIAFVLWQPTGVGLSPLLACLIVLAMVWCMNLYNFMDGANGLAGGMTVVGFGAYAIAAHAQGAGDLAMAASAIAGAALGFLGWNFDPARIFLGDAGSVTLGFLAAAIGFLGWQREVWPVWFPLLVFSPFILDATVTLLVRMRRGEAVWRAHKSHYYQRLVRMGWSHRRLALAAYALMAATGGSALLIRVAGPWCAGVLLAIWGAAYLAMAVLIDRSWSAFTDGAR